MISPVHANALYRVVAANRFQRCLEVGMAYGGASLAIGSALRSLGLKEVKLTSIDPFQTTQYEGLAVLALKREGLSDLHELIEDFDYLALPRLVEQQRVIDFAYIDGWHTFDYTLIDFFYADRILRVGGVVGFNDCGYLAVHRVLRFLMTHRRYEEIDVGLAPDYRASNLPKSVYRRLTRFGRQDRYFRKTEAWEPPWNFYRRF